MLRIEKYKIFYYITIKGESLSQMTKMRLIVDLVETWECRILWVGINLLTIV